MVWATDLIAWVNFTKQNICGKKHSVPNSYEKQMRTFLPWVDTGWVIYSILVKDLVLECKIYEFSVVSVATSNSTVKRCVSAGDSIPTSGIPYSQVH